MIYSRGVDDDWMTKIADFRGWTISTCFHYFTCFHRLGPSGPIGRFPPKRADYYCKITGRTGSARGRSDPYVRMTDHVISKFHHYPPLIVNAALICSSHLQLSFAALTCSSYLQLLSLHVGIMSRSMRSEWKREGRIGAKSSRWILIRVVYLWVPNQNILSPSLWVAVLDHDLILWPNT
jgi:hypothetical protein